MFDSPEIEALHDWESFYVIVGSAAAALTGLMFVVIVLSAEARMLKGSSAVKAFATPNVFHFTLALVLSCMMAMPHQTSFSLHVCVTATGLGGLIFVIVALVRARRQKAYSPELSDWIWHMVLPAL